MPIEKINLITPVQPIKELAPKEQLSKTDWKTHTLVVISYFLINIGFALAASSFYLATAIHPMIATASPAFPIAIGTLILQYVNRQKANAPQPIKQAPIEQPQPLGINNASNNCWINAMLQLIFNVPAFRTVMENVPQPESPQAPSILDNLRKKFLYLHSDPTPKTVKDNLSPLVEQFETYKREQLISPNSKTSSVDSQKIREWLHQYDPSISAECDVSDDFIFLFQRFMKMTRHGFHREMSIETYKENNHISANLIGDDTFYFDLTSILDGEKNNLTDAFVDYFDHFTTVPSGNIKQSIRFLEKAPDDLSVVISSAHTGLEKIVNPLTGAMEISLNRKCVGEDADYICDGFIRHLGKSRESGHYVAYFLNGNTWMKANDSLVHAITRDEAAEELATASFIHYRKYKPV